MTHVYIAGLGHSGSTMLCIALGAASKAVAVGEVAFTVRKHQDHANGTCTCGKAVNECEVWGGVVSGTGVHLPLCDAYHKLFDRGQTLPNVEALIDSSKSMQGLLSVPVHDNVKLKVILLMKDPRSYLASYLRRRKRKGIEHNEGPALIAVFRYLRRWFKGNRDFFRILEKQGFDYFPLLYEQLVFETEAVQSRLSSFLGFDVSLNDLETALGRIHMPDGNRVKSDPNKASTFRYDYAWMYDPLVTMASALTMPLVFWVRRRVLAADTARGK